MNSKKSSLLKCSHDHSLHDYRAINAIKKAAVKVLVVPSSTTHTIPFIGDSHCSNMFRTSVFWSQKSEIILFCFPEKIQFWWTSIVHVPIRQLKMTPENTVNHSTFVKWKLGKSAKLPFCFHLDNTYFSDRTLFPGIQNPHMTLLN